METQEIKFVQIGPHADYMARKDAAKYLNMSLPTYDGLIAMSKSGRLNPPLPIYRATPTSKPYVRKAKLDDWIELRELAKK